MAHIGQSQMSMTDDLNTMEIKIASIADEWPSLTESNEWMKVLRKKAKKVMDSSVEPVVRDKVEVIEHAVRVVSEDKTKQSGKKDMSFGDLCRSRPKDTVLLIGDSMVRGIGVCLEKNSGICTKMAYGGAKIRDIEQTVSELGEKMESHIVVMVGTNDLKHDGSVQMIKKYESLFNEIKKHKFRKISVVGILERTDVGDVVNSRRLGVNLSLKTLCCENGFGFVEGKVGVELLGRDGLHLTKEGQDAMARVIFNHCKKNFLD